MRIVLIANVVVALEGVAVAFSVVTWGVPALVIGLPVLFASILTTVVLWLTVVPQQLMRDVAAGRPTRAVVGRAGSTGLRPGSDAHWSGMGSMGGSYEGTWPAGSGPDGEHCGPDNNAEPSSWSSSSCDGPSWSESSSSSASSSSGSDSSSSSSSSDSSSSSG